MGLFETVAQLHVLKGEAAIANDCTYSTATMESASQVLALELPANMRKGIFA